MKLNAIYAASHSSFTAVAFIQICSLLKCITGRQSVVNTVRDKSRFIGYQRKKGPQNEVIDYLK